MDIEGAEYETLLATPRSELRRFAVIIVELHHLEDLLREVSGRGRRTKATLQRLTLDFRVAHLHPNNCMPRVSAEDCIRLSCSQGETIAAAGTR